jgi:Ribbon-helix-helix protein, copG family
MYAMRRTTVFLEEPLLKRARQYARREGKSFAQVVREAIAAYVTRGTEPGRSGALPSFAGRFSRGDTDTSTRADDLLWPDPHA